MEDILTLGDLHTANDYIERLSQGEALPDSNYQTAFDSFFPEQVDLIYDCLDRERPIWAHFIERIRKGKTPDGQTARIAHLEFGAQAEAQRDTLADSIEAWFDLKQRRVDSDPDAIRILTELGFSIRQLETVCDQQRTYITFEADVPHPSRVLIPAFGSDFQGRYRVLCVWDSPDEEELLDHLANIDYGHALLVFYFGTLSVLARRRLAHLCRQRRHQKGSKAIVIDDILFLYVMSHPRGIRMRTLFECGLPFTVSEPYNAQSSHVATEMFYGRERELERIFNPKDTSLIYGGRQLGKTALLHYAASQFNQHPKRHACYIDLNANLVGITQKPSYVWRLITESLIDEGVLEDTVPVSVRPDKLNDLISTWLSEDTERRILILLDEADRFFEFDSQQHYAQTQQLKGLMESTERRFKVVFAGLHNVYRSSRDPNQPLHHLQEPICIGPLLVETEKKAAAALVEQPLKALGYRFESPDLVSLILSQTNYYPSLIQLYCQQLLKDLGESTHVRFDPRLTPPYLITSQQIRHSYEQHDLFMRIRKKFELTIELDERYAIIANSIALAILEGDKNGDDVTGFAVDWIKDACIGWWELGFRGSADEEDVRTLVEEMVGLGVLRRIAVKGENRVQRYTLRSPNVLTLLGTREEIEQALLKERRPRPTNDPITFRSPCDDGLLAPLTAQQSNNLVMPENGITLIFGTIASSIHRVADYLQSRAMDADVRVFTAGTETTAFVNWLEENTSSHRKAGVTLLVVPESIPWSSHWIEMAEGRIASLSSSRAFVRVVFLGDADTAMRFTREHEKRLPQIETLQVQIITLTPWHANALYLWLDQMEPSVDEAMAKHISHATANWPFLLDHLRGIVQTGTMSWPPVLAQFTRLLQDNKSEFLRAFGLTDEYQRNILAAIAAWDGLDGIFKDDLLDLLHEEYQEPLIRDVLRWAGSLSLTVRKEGRICLTPPLQELLRP
ncbi:MAG: hypothetical protein R2834_20415 [Rhodothermales bacterium]